MIQTAYCSQDTSHKLFVKGYVGEQKAMPTYNAITLDNAARWLRDVKHIQVQVESEYIDQSWESDNDKTYVFYTIELWQIKNGEVCNITFRHHIEEKRFTVYEEAMEFAIKYAVSVFM